MDNVKMLIKEDIDNIEFSNFVFTYGDLKGMISDIKYYTKEEKDIKKANDFIESLKNYMEKYKLSKKIAFYIKNSYRKRVREFKQKLKDLGIVFKRIGWDYYDNSLELYEVPNDFELNEDMQKFIFNAGFARCFVNHIGKYETHYFWNVREEFKLDVGWKSKSSVISSCAE